MSASSFIELYLTVFGWILYDNFWGILTDTGIAYLPFIGVLVKNFVEPYTSQNERDASVTSIRRMEVDVFSMLTVIVLAAQPFLPISIGGSTATTACSSGEPVSGGATGTTFDSVFSVASIGGQAASVPIWWMAVMRLSAGITNAAILSIPCNIDLRQIKYEFDNEQVADPETLRQLSRFVSDCWAPARAYFSSSLATLPAGTDPNDINWIGSPYLLSEGYYDRYQARRAVPGFPFQATKTGNTATGRDSPYYRTDLPKPKWGYPLCSDWWSDPEVGLRKRILAEVDPPLVTEIVDAMTAQGLSETEAEDLIVRGLAAGEETLVGAGADAPNSGFLSGGPGNLAAAAGAKIEQITLIPKIILLKQASPIVQSLLLMLLYATLPFILVFSSYSIGTVITVSIILFAIKFLSVFWEIARWLDTNLQSAILIGQGRADVAARAYDFFFTNGLFDTVNQDILDLSLGILYVVVPIAWLFALGLAGLRIGSGIGSFVNNATTPIASAGEKGGSAAKGFATKGAGKLGKK